MSDKIKKAMEFTSPKKLFNLGLGGFISAIVFGITAICIKPFGVIDTSILWFTAQMLIFSGSCLMGASGINAILSNKFLNISIDADRDGKNDLK